MISDKLKIIFLHPNKCGGKSIEKALWGVDPVPGSADHRTMSEYLEENRDVYLSYYKFMFCRNPWDRLVSIYHGRRQILNKQMPTFEEFVVEVDPAKSPFFSQVSWIKSDGGVQVDFIGRFERYGEDWRELDFGVSLPHLNASKHKHYTDLYTPHLRDIVAEKYIEDIEFFGYSFNGFSDSSIDHLRAKRPVWRGDE